MSERQENVKVVLRQQTWEVEPGLTARQLLKRLNLNPESYLVTRNGELISDDTVIQPGDTIRLVAVISGG
ncbi:MAG: MoaD/ThiS family protein [Ardenticatenia bacterium]|nr:MoaD/ThiS family protein [Ardenticatenia bacterium]